METLKCIIFDLKRWLLLKYNTYSTWKPQYGRIAFTNSKAVRYSTDGNIPYPTIIGLYNIVPITISYSQCGINMTLQWIPWYYNGTMFKTWLLWYFCKRLKHTYIMTWGWGYLLHNLNNIQTKQNKKKLDYTDTLNTAREKPLDFPALGEFEWLGGKSKSAEQINNPKKLSKLIC